MFVFSILKSQHRHGYSHAWKFHDKVQANNTVGLNILVKSSQHHGLPVQGLINMCR